MKYEADKPPEESGELMYVKCAYCGKWVDVKPGQMNWVSHGLCDECLAKEMEKIRSSTREKNLDSHAPGSP